MEQYTKTVYRNRWLSQFRHHEFRHDAGRKRQGDYRKQQQSISIGERRSCPAYEFKDIMMVDPGHQDNQKAQGKPKPGRPFIDHTVPKRCNGSGRVNPWNFNLQHQQRNGYCKNTIAKSLQSSVGRFCGHILNIRIIGPYPTMIGSYPMLLSLYLPDILLWTQ